MRRPCSWLLAASVALFTWPSSADELSASEHFRKALEEDRTLSFQAALADYRAALRLEPSAAFAKQAESRIAYLALRDDDDFKLLRALERQRQPGGGGEGLDELERIAIGTPSERTLRAEALLFVGEARLRIADSQGATRAFEEVRRTAPERLSREIALSRLYEIATRASNRTLAADVANDPETERSIKDEWARGERRRRARWASFATLTVFALAVGYAFARTRKRPAHWVPHLATMAWIGLGGFLASRYEESSLSPFLLFASASLPVLVGAEQLGALAKGPKTRVALAVLASAATISAAFLVLERTDVAYLKGFGL